MPLEFFKKGRKTTDGKIKRKYRIPEDCSPSDFPQIDLQFRESKEEVWSKIQTRIKTGENPLYHEFCQGFFYPLAIAASMLFPFGDDHFFFVYYTKTVFLSGRANT